MNPREHELQMPFGQAPALGTWLQVAPGLHWVRMPLPFALDHINLWVLDDEIDGRRGYTLIDCGLATDETRAAWERIYDECFGGLPLLRVICTHFHPDHFGLAYWHCAGGEHKRWQAPLWMSAAEYSTGRMLSMQSGELGAAAGERAAEYFGQHGLADPQARAKLAARGARYYPKLVPAVPMSYHRMLGGDEIAIGPAGAKRVFRAIVGYGHSVEHVSLVCDADRLLVSGDMVLPRISTNVSVFDVDPDADPLRQYLRSLDHYLMLPADTLVLPSHGLPFRGLHARVAQQHAHHEDRLAEVRVACADWRSATEIVPVLFRRELDLHQLSFALGESVAHLNALWRAGSLQRERGADGVLRFRAA